MGGAWEVGVGAAEPGAIRVPVGDGAERWTSRGTLRRVLLVVHNVTSAGRLRDVLPLFHDDFRVQLLVTCTGSSAFRGGVDEVLDGWGLPVVPWQQALRTPVDLAISASFGGELHRIRGKLSVLSHGVGYTKKLHSEQRAVQGQEATFGLSEEWLLVDGKPFVDGLVLSHPEQVERLERACPPAAPAAVLAGDPCFDRMLAARPHRERFRRALGVRRGQRLVVLNSTWNPEGFFGTGGGEDVLPSLLPRLTAELPADDYRLAAVLHPNIWHGHGPGQIRAWLDRACRSGLTLVDPVGEWRQALLAADLVLGDFGAVTYYGAALGTPVLLAAAAQERLDPDAPLATFVREAPRLDRRGPLRAQFETLLAEHHPLPGPAQFTTSAPGASAALLRRHFYAQLALPELAGPALLNPLPPLPHRPARPTAPLHVRTRVRGQDVWIERSTGHPYDADGATHLAVHEETRDPGDLATADILLCDGPPDDPGLGGPLAWTAETLTRHRHCALAGYLTGRDGCTVRSRTHGLFTLTASARADADPAAYASALHAWLTAGGTPPKDGTSSTLSLHLAGAVHPFLVHPVTPDVPPHTADAARPDSAGGAPPAAG